MTKQLSLAQEAILREHFEIITAKTYGWDNYVQEKGMYKSRTINAMWIGMKYGFRLGLEAGEEK